MKSIFFAIALMGAMTAFASDKSCPSVQQIAKRDYNGLLKYTNDNQFSSLECFIQALPEDVRSFRTYVKKSLSLQEASALHPRAIVASNNGGFALTFNGHKSQKGYNEIEFLALDSDEAPTQWVAGSVVIEQGHAKIKRAEQKCASCHGNPIRPIFGEYPDWPGFYGSVDDWLPDPKDLGKGSIFFESDQSIQDDPTSPYYNGKVGDEARLTPQKIQTALRERQEFLEHRKMAKTHPRYSHLEKASDETSPVYPFTEVYRERNTAFRANINLGSALARRHSQIMYNRLKQNKLFQHFAHSMSYLDYCTQGENSEERDQRHKIFKNLNLYYKQLYGKELALSLSENSYLETSHLYKLFGFSELFYSFEFANDLEIHPEEFEVYGSGYLSPWTRAFSAATAEVVASWDNTGSYSAEIRPFSDPYETLEQFDEETRKRISYVRSKYLGGDFYSFLNQGSGSHYVYASNHQFASDEQKAAYPIFCKEVQQRSDPELTSNFKDLEIPQAIEEQYAGPWPAALNSCVECHDGPHQIGVRIPFRDQDKLKAYNENYFKVSTALNFFDIVEIMTAPNYPAAHDGGLRMPLGRMPLTEMERQDILNWIKGN